MTTPQTAPAAAGEVFAAGHAESGNDLPVLLSTCKASESLSGRFGLDDRPNDPDS